jgi:hypothetical protein
MTASGRLSAFELVIAVHVVTKTWVIIVSWDLGCYESGCWAGNDYKLSQQVCSSLSLQKPGYHRSVDFVRASADPRGLHGCTVNAVVAGVCRKVCNCFRPQTFASSLGI